MRTHKEVVRGWHPFTDKEIKQYIKLGYWHNLTVCDLLDRNAERFPDKLAVADDQKEVTWKHLQLMSKRVAMHFLRLGVKYGDFFVLQLPNIAEFFYIYFGLNRIGVIPVMCLPTHRKFEVNAEVELHRAVGICCAIGEKFNYVNMVNEIKSWNPYLKIFLTVGRGEAEGWIALENLLNNDMDIKPSENYLEKFKPQPSDICAEQLSGGTTGIPKGIPRTHNDYICQWDYFSRAIGFNDETVVLCIGPVAHNAGIACTAGPVVWSGGSIILTKFKNPEKHWEMIEKYKVTASKLFPTLISYWIKCWEKARKYDLSSHMIVGSGGTKVRPEYIKWIFDQGWRFVNIFGMAEGPIIMTRHQTSKEKQLNSVGKPLIQGPGIEIMLVDEKNKEIKLGETGEMKMKGALTFKGYFRNTQENAKSFDDEGYFHSGDLMSLRKDGVYVVEGRIKDMIIRGGENVFPEPIEDTLTKNPKILTATCVGMPDPKLDERLCAFVQLVKDEIFTFEEMQQHMKKTGIAVYQWPERLEVVSGWPLTPANKISKKMLRAWITTRLFKEGSIPKELGNEYLKNDKLTIDDVLFGRIHIEFSGRPK